MIKWLWGKKQDPKIDQSKQNQKLPPQVQQFDPDKIQAQKYADDMPITTFNSDYKGFIQPTQLQIRKLVQDFKGFPVCQQQRHQLASKNGGKTCGDSDQVKKIRSICKQVVKQIGRKILSGNLNLTRISFPIKAMYPKSALQSSLSTTFLFPLYINKACLEQDPLQRFKLVIPAMTSYIYYLNMFLKPLNPILGETLQAQYNDGSKIYLQQISHHPPISYFLMIGPNQQYRFYGCYNFQAGAGLNSMTLSNNGYRTIVFKNGQTIKINFAKNIYSGVFMGQLKQQTVGYLQFNDQENKIQCKIQFSGIKKKPSDYFSGKLLKNGKLVDNILGSTMSHLDIGTNRYFDGRYVKAFKPTILQSQLLSDFRHRQDLKTLRANKILQAQVQKQKLQQFQRRDAKLRKEYEKK